MSKFYPLELPGDLKNDMPVFSWHDNIVDISGHAKPEFAHIAWANFIQNLKIFIEINKGIIVNFKLDYYNSSSSRFITEMFRMLNASKNRNKVNWYHFTNDEDSIETAEIYTEDYPRVYIKLIERND